MSTITEVTNKSELLPPKGKEVDTFILFYNFTCPYCVKMMG